jgi:DNA helicase IV
VGSQLTINFFLLKTIYPNATFTISGDVNQSDGLRLSQDNWNSIKTFLDADIHIINTCFRSSKKIIETLNQRMSNKIYGEAQGWTGKTQGVVKTISSLNDFLLNHYKSNDSDDICIIYLKEETKELLLKLSNQYQFKIYNAYETKGMEFHTVVILDTDLIVQNNFKTKFFYMLVSRAIVNLFILDVK